MQGEGEAEARVKGIFTLLQVSLHGLQAPCSCEEAEVLPAILFSLRLYDKDGWLELVLRYILNDSEDFSTGRKVSRLD